MRKLSVFVTENCAQYEDGTWSESYEYHIVDDLCGEEIDNWDGFSTEEAAREAGLKKLDELKARYGKEI